MKTCTVTRGKRQCSLDSNHSKGHISWPTSMSGLVVEWPRKEKT
jgi:hypothetical protein